ALWRTLIRLARFFRLSRHPAAPAKRTGARSWSLCFWSNPIRGPARPMPNRRRKRKSDMKPEVHIFEVTGSYISTAADFAVDTSRSRALSGSFAAVEEAVLSSQARRSSSAIHIVGVLAFTQSL